MKKTIILSALLLAFALPVSAIWCPPGTHQHCPWGPWSCHCDPDVVPTPSPTPPPTPSPTPEPTSTPTPEPSPTPEPTITPEPTPEPSPEPPAPSGPRGQMSFLQTLPKVVFGRFHNGVVEFLSSKFGYGSLLCSRTSQQFALNEWSQVFDGTKENLAGQMFGASNNYGYEMILENNGLATYFRFPFTYSGVWFCRPLVRVLFSDILGQEIVIVN